VISNDMLTILLIGFGDVAKRLAVLLQAQPSAFRCIGLTRRAEEAPVLRALGVTPWLGDLDNYRSLRRLPCQVDIIVHLAPPSNDCNHDPRLARLAAVVRRQAQPPVGVYISTTGVYGDRQGAWVDECTPVNPESARAKRRVAAEAIARQLGWLILRVPGIYAADRLPIERLQKGLPALLPAEDGYSNHIHADDLARAILAAIRQRLSQRFAGRVVNVVDDGEQKMGDYFDAVAVAAGLPKPPRLSRTEVQATVSPMQYSFMRESRRIRNQRLHHELKLRLRYPTAQDFLDAHFSSN
jgi:nucleoside-diphosphate-sugar epimerase